MGCGKNAGHGGHGRNSGQGGCGQGGHGRDASATVPRKASEVGACNNLGKPVFAISLGNKGKDGDMLCTSIKKMTTYIGTKYGDEAAQEWTGIKKINLLEPAYSQAIWDRHAARVRATRERIELKLRSLRAEKMAIKTKINDAPTKLRSLREEKMAIETKINTAPTNCRLLKELQEVDNKITKGDIKLNNEVKMRLTDSEKITHSNAWHTHQETTESLKKSRGKVYSLLLGQCTQVLVDKMKQDVDWVTISESFDPSLLFKLIEKFVLKQSNNQYKMAVLIAEQLSILSFRQDNQVGNAVYYDHFTTGVEVACQAGVCYYSPELLEDKTA